MLISMYFIFLSFIIIMLKFIINGNLNIIVSVYNL
jgi:hypothetical protein